MPPKKKNTIEATTTAALGQFFTVAEELQNFVFNKVQHKGSELLEPSFGAGHLLKKFKESDANYPMTCYEIDGGIKPIIEFNSYQKIIYGDFLKAVVGKKFRTIIGNPPFVACPGTKNLYIQFIELCYQCLEDDGELIFIVPSDFIKLTSAAPIITTMAATGSFTDFLFPHNEKLFDGASIDVVAFRYQKGLLESAATVNGCRQAYTVNDGIITFRAQEGLKGNALKELFSVFVGLVSGRDEIYKNADIGNVDILMDKDKMEKFIFVESWPPASQAIQQHLEAHKEELMGRRIRKFTEDNWYQWGAPRNIGAMRRLMGQPCIYVRTLTRQKEVAFVGTVQFFGGGLLCLVPSGVVDLGKIVSYLNSLDFKKDYLYAGRFKIGHKQISNVILPSVPAPQVQPD